MRLGVRVEGPLSVSCRVLLGWGWKLWQQSVKGSVNSARHWAKEMCGSLDRQHCSLVSWNAATGSVFILQLVPSVGLQSLCWCYNNICTQRLNSLKSSECISIFAEGAQLKTAKSYTETQQEKTYTAFFFITNKPFPTRHTHG